ncbi:MAG: hypothetical protein JSS98_06625 [Bacteroidetes bacterium]|nr:hypothetical protein [Bacteroidota bacterium]
MVKISTEQKQKEKKYDDAKQDYITSFSSRFTIEKLKDLFKEEEPNKIKFILEKKAYAGENNVKNNYTLKENDYDEIYPKCLKYIRDNIYRADKGLMFYIISINSEGNLSPIEFTKEEMNAKLNFFPDDLKTWFTKYYCTEYRIDCNNTEHKVYVKHSINHLNIFNGYRYDGLKFNDKIHQKRKQDIEFVWNHVSEVLCSKSERVYQEVKNWICALIGGRRKLTTAWYLKGKRGVGKSVIVRLLMKIISVVNCFTVKHQNQIIGEFNGHFLAKVLGFIDDVEFTGPNFLSFGEVMKTYITEEKIAFRDLFKTASQMSNITSWIIAGNQDVGALKDGNANERSRYIVSDVSPILKSNDYFKRLNKLVDDDEEFLKAFYFDCLLNYNSEYNEQESIKSLPITKTKEEQIQKSMPSIAKMFKYYLAEEPIEEFFNVMKYSEFYNMFYTNWHKNHNNTEKNLIHKHQLFNELQTMNFVSIKQRKIDGVPYKNTIIIDKEKLMAEFVKLKYIVESDDIEIKQKEENVLDQVIKLQDEIILLQEKRAELLQTLNKSKTITNTFNNGKRLFKCPINVTVNVSINTDSDDESTYKKHVKDEEFEESEFDLEKFFD